MIPFTYLVWLIYYLFTLPKYSEETKHANSTQKSKLHQLFRPGKDIFYKQSVVPNQNFISYGANLFLFPEKQRLPHCPCPCCFKKVNGIRCPLELVLWCSTLWQCEMGLSIPAGLIWMLVKNSLSSFLSWDKYLSHEGFIFIRWFSAVNHFFNLKKEFLIESLIVCIMAHKLQTPGWKDCD